jgi:hypothetical protein
MVLTLRRRPLRPDAGAPHVGYDVVPPANRQPTAHDELRHGPRPGMPAYAGSAPTRLLELAAATPVHDQRGTIAGWLHAGDVVPVGKGIGPAGAIVHVITDGPLAGRIIYRHRPGVMGAPGRPVALRGEGPS